MRIKKIISKIFNFLFFPFVYFYRKALEKHLIHLEKKIRREIEIGLSHELKTPLTCIFAYSELLSDRLENPEDKKAAMIIYKKSQDLMRLVNNMILISVIDFNPASLEKEEINIAEITIETINHFKKVYQDLKDYDIHTEISHEILILGNRSLLSTIIFELLNNAYLYKKEDESAIITIGLKKLGRVALLSVEDRGYGISPKNIQRIFDKFYRLEERDHAQTPGLGIGLSLVKKGVALMDGTLQIKSEPDKGTLIQIRFPLIEKYEKEFYL